MAELGAYGVNLHDNDLVPVDATAAEQARIVKEFKDALRSTDMRVPMATTNLFTDPVFKDGAFTSSDTRVRTYAVQKTMRSMDLGVELGARTYVFWGGREGAEVDAAKDPMEALKWFRDALDFLCEYAIDRADGLHCADVSTVQVVVGRTAPLRAQRIPEGLRMLLENAKGVAGAQPLR